MKIKQKSKTIIKQADFARIVGVSPQRITKAIHSGLIKTDPENRIEFETNIDRWYKYLDPSKVRDFDNKSVKKEEALMNFQTLIKAKTRLTYVS